PADPVRYGKSGEDDPSREGQVSAASTASGGQDWTAEALDEEELLTASDRPFPGLLHLGGLWLCGGVTLEGELSLDLVHCTLNPPIPGDLGPALTEVDPRSEPRRQSTLAKLDPARLGFSASLGRIWVERSIVGPILLRDFRRVLLIESLVDEGELSSGRLAVGPPESYEASGYGPILEVESCTLFGRIRSDNLNARNSLFADRVETRARRGRLESCYLPRGSATGPNRGPQGPASHEPAMGRDPVPNFVSRRFGDPGYAVLDPAADEQLLSGADDGGEIGVFHGLYRAQRRENLADISSEYLPWGCFARSFYITPDTGIWRYRRDAHGRRPEER
ncbi:MAG: hypothetical protein MI919_14935, partial [Holophagales bacterium]|nr:hypothetical protein [Holophagales bacterium]